MLRSVFRHLPVNLTPSHRLLHSTTAPRGFLSTNLQKHPSKAAVFAPKSLQFRQNAVSRDVHVAPLANEMEFDGRITILKAKLEAESIQWHHCIIGQNTRTLCPKCGGGDLQEQSFSIFIAEDGKSAIWRCYRGECGWSGRILDGKKRDFSLTSISKVTKCRVITEKQLQLEPLGDEIISYFRKRLISEETLRRNAVMQQRYGYDKQPTIAFTYKRDGNLVSCKYRKMNKKFHQEKDTERIFYGLDDIKNETEVIIVEGEIDKLSMEEAGYRNCVSVPDGAPAKVSKELPTEEQDTRFRFLWNCREYLDKANRIILATDGDGPGQALAEELARRLGEERCRRVKWPEKTAKDLCNDANEVLIFKGPLVLRSVIENAKL